MNRYTIQKTKHYVVATMSDPTMFLFVNPIKMGGGYKFYEKVSRASKFSHKEDAIWAVMDYNQNYEKGFELVVIPLEVKYEIIDETSEVEDTYTTIDVAKMSKETADKINNKQIKYLN